MAIFSPLKGFLVASIISIAASSPLTYGNDLKPLLSQSSEIYFPGSDGYKHASARWSSDIRPGLDVIVKITSEKDVQATIKYANSRKVPFLAINGAHGTSNYLNNIKGGIGIYMRGLSGVSLSPTNSSQAVILGGTLSGEVLDALSKLKKQTVTGGCDCTGFTSPMLGGGHGLLQGRYGLLADNLVSARVVLGDGRAITVDSKQNSDLFWGLKGAGHNFGIVTSVNYQVYDSTPDINSFATSTYIFTQDKLEPLFNIAKQWVSAKNRPVELSHVGNVGFIPNIDSKPVIIFLVYWQAPGDIPSQYTKPLQDLKPVSVTSNRVGLTEVNANTGSSIDGPACAKGNGRQTYPVDLDNWDIPSLRAAYNIFSQMPPALNGSLMLLEGLATNRVFEIPAASAAYPHRSSGILVSPLFTYPADDPKLDKVVADFGRRIRAAFLKGTRSPLQAYVNYANGDEKQDAVYGYEPWRQQRLTQLKKKYDPSGRFNFYEPIKA